ncbi:hypothetical protein [Nonlabens ponticola]|uniref:Membrane metalloprotease n=1 Tax=Nonlabens ponticola TaxID=2496866 RepID=A0A3S9N0H9_9FLAO|nr:hypothetical protein [Nonlabens ponticola]AZQ44930.1 hypothetical protein EJ995_12100 [Nonlabens ponticola]
MKRSLYYIALMFVICIASCSSDESSSTDDMVGVGDDDGGDGSIPNNARSTGASAAELLTTADFDQLVIEAIYLNGAEPRSASLDNLEDFLEARLNKPDGIQIIERNIQVENEDSYTIDEIAQIEEDNRTQFNTENAIAVSVIFANRPNAANQGNSVVLGTAYRNTSLVMFQETIEEFSGGVGQPSRVVLESTVYNHEFGHIMGLVNLGTPLQSDHEDANNPKHCDVDGCLMFFEVNGGNILDLMGLSSVPEFDSQCLADLRANGGR